MMIFFLLLLTLPISVVFSSTECVWATGKLVCKKNPKGVLNATVTLFDLDGPAKVINVGAETFLKRGTGMKIN